MEVVLIALICLLHQFDRGMQRYRLSDELFILSVLIGMMATLGFSLINN